MQNENTGTGVSFDALVRELLGLDPSAMAKLSPTEAPENGAVCAGLHIFMRLTLERALSLVDRPNPIVSLHTDETARAQGWPDKTIGDLHALFVWSLIREPRRVAGLAHAPLRKADRALIELHWKPDDRFSAMATSALVAEARARFDIDVDGLRDAESVPNPISICTLIQQKLGIEPRVLMMPYYRSPKLAKAAFKRDPEGQAAAALTIALLCFLYAFQVMDYRKIDSIRLMTERDAEEGRRPSARVANMTTLLAGALRAHDERTIRFTPARERTDEERASLRVAAKLAYDNGTDQALEGLNWLADGITHFGAYTGFPLGDRLMHSVARECDPLLERMPLLVAVQEARTLSSPEAAMDMVRRAAARRRDAE